MPIKIGVDCCVRAFTVSEKNTAAEICQNPLPKQLIASHF